MPPRPPTPHADRILQTHWEDILEPAELTRRSAELARLSSQLTFASQDGQVGAIRLLNYGHGPLAERISAAWVDYFVRMGITAVQVGEASACLTSWAASLGAMLSNMAGVVYEAEDVISMIEAARPLLELHHIDVEELIDEIVAQAQGQVAAVSAAQRTAGSEKPYLRTWWVATHRASCFGLRSTADLI